MIRGNRDGLNVAQGNAPVKQTPISRQKPTPDQVAVLAASYEVCQGCTHSCRADGGGCADRYMELVDTVVVLPAGGDTGDAVARGPACIVPLGNTGTTVVGEAL